MQLIVQIWFSPFPEFPLELSSSTLDTSGPFRIVNALREIPANGSFVLKLAFEPRSADDYLETLRIRNQVQQYSSEHHLTRLSV